MDITEDRNAFIQLYYPQLLSADFRSLFCKFEGQPNLCDFWEEAIQIFLDKWLKLPFCSVRELIEFFHCFSETYDFLPLLEHFDKKKLFWVITETSKLPELSRLLNPPRFSFSSVSRIFYKKPPISPDSIIFSPQRIREVYHSTIEKIRDLGDVSMEEPLKNALELPVKLFELVIDLLVFEENLERKSLGVDMIWYWPARTFSEKDVAIEMANFVWKRLEEQGKNLHDRHERSLVSVFTARQMNNQKKLKIAVGKVFFYRESLAKNLKALSKIELFIHQLEKGADSCKKDEGRPFDSDVLQEAVDEIERERQILKESSTSDLVDQSSFDDFVKKLENVWEEHTILDVRKARTERNRRRD